MKDVKICLYLEFLHFRKGILFKNIGTGLISSYRNQKKMLDEAGISYTEFWDGRADILQINTPWLKSLWLMKKARRLGMPIIVWAHVTAEDIRGVFRFSSIISPIMKLYLTYAYNQADIILTPSEYTRGLVMAYGIKPEKIIAQSNGVDLKKYYTDMKKREEGRNELALTTKLTVGTVALAIPRKGIDTFIMLAKSFPQSEFVWAGKIYSGALVQKLPADLPSNVRFTGYVADILATYNAFDIFIFASYEENQGMVILEAAAIGLPIIVRDIPVYEGWLHHGKNCLKAKTDEDFKRCVEELANDEALRVRLGRQAKILADENSLEMMIKKMEAVYQRVLTK